LKSDPGRERGQRQRNFEKLVTIKLMMSMS
jgi:hypothetical protein